MNRNKKLLVLVAVIAAAVVVQVVLFRPKEQDRILGQLAALSLAVRISPMDSASARTARIRGTFPHVFGPRVHVEIAEIDGEERTAAELAAFAMSAGEVFRTMELGFDRTHVEIDKKAQPPHADVEAVATLTGADAEGGARHEEKRQTTMRFELIEGEWRIVAIAAAKQR